VKIKAVILLCLVELNFFVAFGFNELQAVKFIGALALCTICGAFTYIRIVRKKAYSLPELIGCGLAIGTIFPGLINLFIRAIGIYDTNANLLYIVCVGVLILGSKDFKNRTQLNITSDAKIISSLLLILPILSLYGWGFRIPAVFLLVLLLALSTIALLAVNRFVVASSIDRFNSRYKSLISTSLVVVGTLIHLLVGNNHSEVWRSFVGVDVAIDEAMSWGVSSFGLTKNVLVQGSPLHLHVLTHAWAGDLAEAIQADPFMISGVVGYFVGLTGISLLLFEIGKQISGKTFVGVISSAVYFLQASMPEEFLGLPAPRMANSMSMLWFVFGVYLVVGWADDSRIRALITTPFFVGVLTISKAQWGLFYLIVIYWSLRRENAWKDFQFLISAVVSIFVFLTIYGVVISPAAGDHATNPAHVINFELGQLLLVLTFLFLRTPFILILVEKKKSKGIWQSLVCSGLFFLPVIFVTDGGFLSSYLLYPILLLSAPIFGQFLFHALVYYKNRLKKNVIISAGFLLGAGGLLSYYFANFRFIDGGRDDIWSFFIVDYPQLIPALSLITVVLFFTDFQAGVIKEFRGFLERLTHVLILATLSINLGVFIVHGKKEVIIESLYDVGSESEFLLSDNQMELSKWIRRETVESAIIGSNYFCSNLVPQLSSRQIVESDCRTRNEFSWISSSTHRQSFLEAPLFSLGSKMSYVELNHYKNSIIFGREASKSALFYLTANGVDYFIVDKEMITTKILAQHSNIVYENDEYLLLKL
jgi:hypothetical protein